MILLITTIATLVASTIAFPYDNRVVNGTDAQPGEIPYIVVLRYGTSFTCGGSILDERHILTAAHCVYGRDASKFSIFYGTIFRKDSTNEIKVESIVYRENYKPGSGNDISILTLVSPIVFSEFAQPIILPPENQPTPGGADCLLAGWGRPSSEQPVMDVLQTAHMIVYTDESCTKVSGITNGDPVVCAGVPEGGKGQCNGDSGGPLYANGYQIGIVSRASKPSSRQTRACSAKGHPGVYTKVSAHVAWILDHMKN